MVLKRIQRYLSKRKQRIKIQSTCSSWEKNLFGAQQTFILGPFADDNTHYVLGKKVDDLLDLLEDDFINLFKYLLDNQMKANSNRCNLITNK